MARNHYKGNQDQAKLTPPVCILMIKSFCLERVTYAHLYIKNELLHDIEMKIIYHKFSLDERRSNKCNYLVYQDNEIGKLIPLIPSCNDKQNDWYPKFIIMKLDRVVD